MWMWLLSSAHAAPTMVVCADTWVVDPKVECVTLDTALQSDASTILLSPGVHRTFDTVLTGRDVEIRALDPSEPTVLAPSLRSTSDTVLIIDGGTVLLYGFAVVPGFDYDGDTSYYDLRGLAVTGGATVSLDTMQVLQGFHSINGGGLWIDGKSTVDISHSEFGTNFAVGSGGHVYVRDSRLTVTDTTFVDGAAESGGGIAAVESRLVIDRAQFATLSALEGGGVFAFRSPEVSIHRSVLCGLGANYGGAVNLLESCSSSCDIDNSVVQWNSAAYSGGGLWVDVPAGPVRVSHNNFFENLAGPHGSAAEFFEGTDNTFTNNLVVQNRSGGAAVMFSELGMAQLGVNAWYDNAEFPLAGGDGAALALPVDDFLLDQAPVWESGGNAERPACGQLAVLDWADPANAVLADNTIGALSSDIDQDGVAAQFDCDDRDPTVGPCRWVVGGGGCTHLTRAVGGLGVPAWILLWGLRRRSRRIGACRAERASPRQWP